MNEPTAPARMGCSLTRQLVEIPRCESFLLTLPRAAAAFGTLQQFNLTPRYHMVLHSTAGHRWGHFRSPRLRACTFQRVRRAQHPQRTVALKIGEK